MNPVYWGHVFHRLGGVRGRGLSGGMIILFCLTVLPGNVGHSTVHLFSGGALPCPGFLEGASVGQMRPAELRLMARQCGSERLESLYLNRAVANELAESYRQYRRLDSVKYGQNDRGSFESYRMTIALMEAFAAYGYASGDQPETELIDALNQGYELFNDVAEMRLKGYDRVADYQLRQWMKALN